jgi:hypothetical protein
MIKKPVVQKEKHNEKQIMPIQQQSKEIVTSELSKIILKDSHENSGFETMTAADIAIPFILVLQALSPQIRGDNRIEGANEGDFYNTVTNFVYGEQIQLIPCAFNKAWVEWSPREKGGGFIRQYSDISILDKCIKNDKNQDMLKSGNIIVTTAYHYCILLHLGNIERVVVALTSTQLKKSRRWNSQMMALQINTPFGIITPPMFSHIYKAVTIEERNDQGSWAGWDISSPQPIGDINLYTLAKKFHDDVTKGIVKTAIQPNLTEHVNNRDFENSQKNEEGIDTESEVF